MNKFRYRLFINKQQMNF